MKEQEADDSDQDEDEVNGNDEEDSEFGDGEEGRNIFTFVILCTISKHGLLGYGFLPYFYILSRHFVRIDSINFYDTS